MGGGEAGMPSEEELQAALDEQMRRLTVPDVIIQTVVTLINLGARKLGLTQGAEGGAAEERDLDQARMAIEATRALLPLVPAEVGQIREALSQLQMAYAQEARGEDAPAAAQGPGSPDPEPAPGAPSSSPADDPERAKARAKIWTPGSG
jgi:hypothetical protein